ncbi:hypothetical protein OS493_004703 [Desmophyllum pertusum]|uniref:Uncharacterized protein n=1 Tax=Desmophyllum pertusum TaxID=174260 RepID=A0A9X0CZB2_9CNID|nr:hypothetical protein OS493_004703 [Desmophyllum pertusum]
MKMAMSLCLLYGFLVAVPLALSLKCNEQQCYYNYQKQNYDCKGSTVVTCTPGQKCASSYLNWYLEDGTGNFASFINYCSPPGSCSADIECARLKQRLDGGRAVYQSCTVRCCEGDRCNYLSLPSPSPPHRN